MATIAKSGIPSLATPVPPSNARLSGLLAGEAIAAGDALYIKTDGKFWKATGAANNAAAKVAGFASQPADVGTAVTAYFNVTFYYGAALTPGARYFLSATAGAIDDAATVGGLTPVGYAVDATRIRLWETRE